PEEERGVVGCGDAERLELAERQGGVVVFGCVGAVGVAELPGRVGVDDLVAPGGEGRGGGEGGVAAAAFDASGGGVGGQPAGFQLLEEGAVVLVHEQHVLDQPRRDTGERGEQVAGFSSRGQGCHLGLVGQVGAL